MTKNVDKKEKNLDKERLGKLVKLAKEGFGGEKTVAIGIIKKLCKQYDLEFDDVMSERHDLKDFTYRCSSAEHFRLAQVIFVRYAMIDIDSKMGGFRGAHALWMETTLDKFIEASNATDVLWKLYKQEKKDLMAVFFDSFRAKHDLYYHPQTDEQKKKVEELRKKNHEKLTKKDYEQARRAGQLARDLKDAEIHKRITSGGKK